MKYVLALGAALVLFGSATAPSLAACGTSTHYADAAVPPECLISDTKAKHPDWYRDGGYCVGATATRNVTAFTNDAGCITS